jgi:penicillin-binding protein 1C
MSLLYFAFCLPKTLFETEYSTLLLSEKGQVLSARIASDEQWRFPLIDSVPKKFETAIIHFEDRSFRSHIGVSFTGIARAIYLNLKHSKVVSGGSTIPMQVIRLSRQNKSRTLWEKGIEMIWAVRLGFRYSKDDILKLYATHAPFGGNTVGLETASWRYFNRSPKELSWAESCLLAVLPNAPGLLHLGKNRSALLKKRNSLLTDLFDCQILDSITYQMSLLEGLPTKPNPLPNRAPHLLDRMKANGFGGQRIKTSVNRRFQKQLNQQVLYAHQHLKSGQIENLSAVIIDIELQKVVAYVGNTYENGVDGRHVDMLSSSRSSGSILKPFLYGTAIDNALIFPSSLIRDVPVNLYGYDPTNYFPDYDGVVPAHEALQRSLNIPAVLLLQELGVGPFKHELNQLGLKTINRSSQDYGLSLALGGAEVNLLQLTNAYAHLAAKVSKYPEDVSSFRTHFADRSILDVSSASRINVGTCYSILNTLSEVSRPIVQNHWKQFNSGQKIAWKTGTSIGHRDAWAVGVNKKYAVGVWAGNADGEGRPGLTGLRAAAPLLFQVFNFLPQQEWFDPPYDEMIEVALCAKSGVYPSPDCPKTQKTWVPKHLSSGKVCRFHKTVFLNNDKQYRVFKNCYSGEIKTDKYFILNPVEGAYYALHQPNYKVPPSYLSNCKTRGSKIKILYPFDNAKVSIPTLLNGKESKVNIKAFSEQKDELLQWYINGTYLGQTRKIHEKSLHLNEGEYMLSVYNAFGDKSRVHFTVVKSNLKLD